MRPLLPALLLALGAACGGDDAGEPDAGGTCGDVRVSPKIYFGTSQPTYAPLTPGQVQAIGSWTKAGSRSIFCSGTLITPTFVLSADHCELQVGDTFCFGDDTSGDATCIGAVAIDSGPTITVGGQRIARFDMAIAELAQDATARVAGVTPIPIVTESLDGLVGHRAETSGYGETENRTSGNRLFALERIDAVGPTDDENGIGLLRVDGQGARGVCFGDSGGPVLIVDSAGAVRVAGALSFGDQSCVDKDRYSRTDVARSWIEGITGPTPAATPAACGPIDAVGTCSGDRALWCDGGSLSREDCAGACGWDTGAEGFRCLTGADPCSGQDLAGSCVGNQARWCDNGVARATDCACLGQSCAVDSATGAHCRVDACGGLDYQGRCADNVAEWCDNGELQRQDCSASGETCQYVDGNIGYACR
jgi:hypothetical protein